MRLGIGTWLRQQVDAAMRRQVKGGGDDGWGARGVAVLFDSCFLSVVNSGVFACEGQLATENKLTIRTTVLT